MKTKKKYLVQQSEAQIYILETTIKEIKVKEEDVDTITLQFIFQNGIRFSKKFCKFNFDYLKNWKNKKIGDSVNLQVKANMVIDII